MVTFATIRSEKYICREYKVPAEIALVEGVPKLVRCTLCFVVYDIGTVEEMLAVERARQDTEKSGEARRGDKFRGVSPTKLPNHLEEPVGHFTIDSLR